MKPIGILALASLLATAAGFSLPPLPLHIPLTTRPIVEYTAPCFSAPLQHRDAPSTPLRSVAFRGGDTAVVKTDTSAIAKYSIALLLQYTLIGHLFTGLDMISDSVGRPFPRLLSGLIFAFLSLRSRTFNILDNERPDRTKIIENNEGEVVKGFNDRILPSWTPPGIFFPIMWVLIITPIRAVTSVMIYNATGGRFSHPALMSLVLHLSVGDVWNTINNTEKRYGTSSIGVLFVLASVLRAVKMYCNVLPKAGKLLAVSAGWITIASLLTFDIWRLNGKERFLPQTNEDGSSKTAFVV